MADFSSLIDTKSNVILNGLDRHERKRLRKKMRKARRRLLRLARHTPDPCNALAVCGHR